MHWQDPVAQPAEAGAPATPTPWSALAARYKPLSRIDPAIVGLTILAFGVAALHLRAQSLSLDESASVTYTSSLSKLGDVLSGGPQGYPNMGLYYVLLYCWQQLFGSGEIALRSLSVLVGGLSVPVMVLLGTRLFGRPAGLLSGLLLALSPFFVHYEQTARSYALLILLVLLSSYFFVRQLEQPSRATLVGYVLSSALSFYAHYMVVFFLPLQALTLLAVKRRAALTREWLGAAGAIGLLCAPEAVWATKRPGVDWVPVPSFSDLIDLPSELAGGRFLLVALLILACYGLFCAIDDRRLWRAGYVAAWFLVPVIVVFAVSKLGRPLWIDRFLIIVLPALLLLAAAGLAQLPGRALGIVVLGVLVAASAVGIRDWYRAPVVEDYRGAAHYVLENERPGDKIIYDPFFIIDPIRYYQDQAGRGGPGEFETSDLALGNRPPRIWVVNVRSVDPESITQSLAGAAYTPVATPRPSFPAPIVTLYQARSTTPPSGNVGRPGGVAGAAAALSHAPPQPSNLPPGWELAAAPQGNAVLAKHVFACLSPLAPQQPSSEIKVTGPGQLKIIFDLLDWRAAPGARSAAAALAQKSSDALRCVGEEPHWATSDFSVPGSGDAGVQVNRKSSGSLRRSKGTGPARAPAAATKASVVYALKYHGPSGAARGALVATTRGSASAVILAYRTNEQPLPPRLLPALVASAYHRLGEATRSVP